MRMVCYLIILLYLGIIERIGKYLEEDLEEEKIRRGVKVKPEAHNIPSSSLHPEFESTSVSRSNVH
jgi:hypothetical protein